ncbi:MAG: RDD family protein [Microbacteriaceae bacterium]
MASTGDLDEQQLMTGEAVALDVRPAGFILRSAGAIIDFIAYIGLFLGLVLAIAVTGGFQSDQALASALVTASLAFSLVVAPVAVELATRGRSLGKLAIGARIVRDDGGAIQFRQAFIRALTGVIEIFMTFGGLAALCALLNSRSKRLGDLLAGTYSQHERVPVPAAAGYAVPPALAAWAQTADAAKLPDRLARRIAGYVAQASAMNESSRARLAAELATEASAFVWPLPAAPAEEFLQAVAAIRRDRDYQALLLEQERLNRLAPVLTGVPHSFPDR